MPLSRRTPGLITRIVRHLAIPGLLGLSSLLPGLGCLTGAVPAQSTVATETGATAGAPPAISSARDVTFPLLATAAQGLTWNATQIRRFRDETGAFVAVREMLTVSGNGSPRAPFKLTFLGVEGQQTTPQQMQRWSELYRRNASLLHEHGGFRVYDAAAAASNYQIFPFGSGMRAGRRVERVVVFPRRFDKAIWLLELDRATALVLYSAEFDPQARLVGDLETISLQTGGQVGPLTTGWAWRPRMQQTRHATPMEALDEAIRRDAEAKSLVLPDLSAVVPDYAPIESHLSENLLNGSTSLVLTYSDGIDAFFVIQTPRQQDPFAGLPANVVLPGRPQPHTIAYFDDPSLRVYLFHSGSVGFTVAGRGALSRLGEVARLVYRQAGR